MRLILTITSREQSRGCYVADYLSLLSIEIVEYRLDISEVWLSFCGAAF